MHSGSPFYHFESKRALLYMVMQEGMAHAMASQRAALAQLAPGLRADLVQVHMAELPDGGRQAVVRGVWREGQRVL